MQRNTMHQTVNGIDIEFASSGPQHSQNATDEGRTLGTERERLALAVRTIRMMMRKGEKDGGKARECDVDLGRDLGRGTGGGDGGG